MERRKRGQVEEWAVKVGRAGAGVVEGGRALKVGRKREEKQISFSWQVEAIECGSMSELLSSKIFYQLLGNYAHTKPQHFVSCIILYCTVQIQNLKFIVENLTPYGTVQFPTSMIKTKDIPIL